MIVMAENAIPTDYHEYIDLPEIGLEPKEKEAIRKFVSDQWRVYGQTPDGLRTGGLKIVSRALEKKINEKSSRGDYWKRFRVFTSEPRHLLRAIPPSSADVIFAHRLGMLAVDSALAGYTDFMISQWVTEYVLVPLALVVLGRKRVPKFGIFWKTVLANTGQPLWADGRNPFTDSESSVGPGAP